MKIVLTGAGKTLPLLVGREHLRLPKAAFLPSSPPAWCWWTPGQNGALLEQGSLSHLV